MSKEFRENRSNSRILVDLPIDETPEIVVKNESCVLLQRDDILGVRAFSVKKYDQDYVIFVVDKNQHKSALSYSRFDFYTAIPASMLSRFSTQHPLS